jgi:hypothetical protein
MPRPRIGAQPMSPAERQARHRAMLRRPNDTQPRLPTPRPSRAGGIEQGRVKLRSRPGRWAAAVTMLVELQEEYRAWLDNLPANLEGSPLADKLQAISELDLEELQAIEPPRGYGRD